jgi:quercetin 2,3-dioxygenase
MTLVDRRRVLAGLSATGVGFGCSQRRAEPRPDGAAHGGRAPLLEAQVAARFELGRGVPWPTFDPFLFCVHHNDRYPRANGHFGPVASLDGRNLGQDFAWKDGWNMYHGLAVPGFPRHPHRGFETVTVVRKGRLDHADSLGALARYGDGDVQWLTAGAGIQHAEMFPLLSDSEDNQLDLFQIWLNLPGKSKFAEPHFSMLWAEGIPERRWVDDEGRPLRLTVRAGSLAGLVAPAAPPDSWASRPENDLAIATLELSRGARWQIPSALSGVTRALYCAAGRGVTVGGVQLGVAQGVKLDSSLPITLEGGAENAEILLLQARPMGEPIARRGPFVMNTDEQLRQAFADFRRTEFGGWPWPDSAPVHGRDPTRFARRASGGVERPG